MKQIFFLLSLFVALCNISFSQTFPVVDSVKKFIADSIRSNSALKATTLKKAYEGTVKFLPDVVQDTAQVTVKVHGLYRFQRKDSTWYVFDTIGGKRWRKGRADTRSIPVENIAANASDASDFEIAVIPDTQKEVEVWPAIGRTKFQMIADSVANWNVKAVISVGDLQDNGITSQMDTIGAWYQLLDDADIPNIPILGNHDYDNNNPVSRITNVYNAEFGPSRYTGKTWYGGNRDGSNDNWWIKFTAGGRKYAVIGLETFPRDAVLNWANALTDSLKDHEILVTTHAYITHYGERGVDSSLWANIYLNMAADNNGQDLWDKYLRLHKNIRFVFNGHYIAQFNDSLPSIKNFSDVGIHGNTVHQILVNYQRDTSGGNGYFMRMQFRPSQGKIDVKFFSAYRNKFDDREIARSFTLDYPALSVENTVSVKGDLLVNRVARFDSAVYFAKLTKFRVPFLWENNRLFDSDNIKVNTNTNLLLGATISDSDSSTIAANTAFTRRNFIRNQTAAIQSAGFRINGQAFITNVNSTNNAYDANLPSAFNVVHGSSNYGLAITKPGADNGAANLTFYHTYHTDAATRVALPDGGSALVGRLTFQSPNTSGTAVRIGADIRVANQVTTENHTSYNFEFRTTEPSNNTLTQRMKIFNTGEIGIGVNPSLETSAQLFVNSTTRGFLPPRMTAAQRISIASPANGLVVYDTDSARLFTYAGAWKGLRHTDEGEIATSGTYTPTISGTSNVDGATASPLQWMRVGNVVTVSGYFEVDPTAAGSGGLTLTLPIASNLTALGHVGGSGNILATLAGVGIFADTAGDRASFGFTSPSGDPFAISFSFTYQVI